jgi:hypothetical protein
MNRRHYLLGAATLLAGVAAPALAQRDDASCVNSRAAMKASAWATTSSASIPTRGAASG